MPLSSISLFGKEQNKQHTGYLRERWGQQARREQGEVLFHSLYSTSVFFNLRIFNLYFESGYTFLAGNHLELTLQPNMTEFLLLLSLPPKYWDYRHVPIHLVQMVLEIKPKSSCMLIKHSTKQVHTQPQNLQSLSKGDPIKLEAFFQKRNFPNISERWCFQKHYILTIV